MMSQEPNGKIESFSYQGEFYSQWPDVLYPIRIEAVIMIRGEEYLRREERIETLGNGTYHIYGDEISFDAVEKDEFQCWFIVTNNYGIEEKIQIR